MSEGGKTALIMVAMWTALEITKRVFGAPVALVIATIALAFCVGALWGAGGRATTDGEGPSLGTDERSEGVNT